MAQAEVLPAFEVEKLDGKRTVIKLVPVKDGPGFEEKEIEIEAGYMVFFPRGHSIRVTEEKLEELGFHRAPNLIDMGDGEVVEQPSTSLKERVSRMTREPRKASSS